MRHLLTIILCLWLSPAWAFSGFLGASTGGAVTATCSTDKDGDLASATADFKTIGYNTIIAQATKFTAGSTYTACSAKFVLYKTGSPTFKIRAAIYTNGTGPGTLVGSPSDEFTVSALTASEATYTLTNMSADLTSGTAYWLVLYYSSGTLNNYVDYVRVPIRTGTSGDYNYTSTNMTTFSAGDAYVLGKTKTVSQ